MPIRLASQMISSRALHAFCALAAKALGAFGNLEEDRAGLDEGPAVDHQQRNFGKGPAGEELRRPRLGRRPHVDPPGAVRQPGQRQRKGDLAGMAGIGVSMKSVIALPFAFVELP